MIRYLMGAAAMASAVVVACPAKATPVYRNVTAMSGFIYDNYKPNAVSVTLVFDPAVVAAGGNGFIQVSEFRVLLTRVPIIALGPVPAVLVNR